MVREKGRFKAGKDLITTKRVGLESWKIAIVGCGTIGTFVAKRLADNAVPRATLAGLCDIAAGKAEALSAGLPGAPPVLQLDELMRACDMAVEAAAVDAVPDIAKAAFSAGIDILAMSVGALVTYPELIAKAEAAGRTIHIPSGALAGLDAVRSAAAGTIRSAVLTTRKPPKALAGAPYIEEKGIDLANIREETVLFEGTAAEAIAGFPKNVNVAAALSLAGIGPEKTRVRIIADPTVKNNAHEVVVVGDAGRIVARTENVPSPDNPKTSYLAALSCVAALKRIVSSVKIG